MRTARHIRCLCLGTIALSTLTGCPPLIPGQTNTFDGIEFQWCPPGTFMMGSPEDEGSRYADETQHEVTITEGFWLSTYEVTQAQWVEVMGNNPVLDYFPADTPYVGDDVPVVMVSWNDVQGFLAALNAGATRATYDLPTEAEWEYACRAGTTTRFPWGDDPDLTDIDEYCWYYPLSGYQTFPVGQKLPNNWGLHDTCGNVYEWCKDWYGDYPSSPVTDPQGPATGTERVGRGGSQQVTALDCRPAQRGHGDPDARGGDAGFRLLRRLDLRRLPFEPPRLFRLPLVDRLPNG